MNKKILVLSLIFIKLTSVSYAASVTTTARIELIEDVSISEVSNLDFGTVALGGVSGVSNVTLTAADVRSLSGSGQASLVGGSESGSPAEYTISGKEGETVQISIDNINSPNNGLALTPTFTAKVDGGSEAPIGSSSTFVLGANTSTVLLGGTMQLTEGGSSSASAGIYTSDAFDFNVIYQ